jgi:DNA mismatch endonuclease (patch repair protein)
LYGSPDIIMTGPRLAVFVDGCFWHGCPTCRRYSSDPFWSGKIDRNRNRDAAVTDRLATEGWRVVRVPEHDVTSRVKLADVADRVTLLARGGA